jgi:hypothetical protein
MDKLWNFQPTDLGPGFGTLDGEDPWVEVISNWGRLQLYSFFASCTSIWYIQLLTYSSPVSWVFCSVAYDGFAADVGDYKSPYGKIGTRFWRAPKVLKALQEKITPTLQKLWMCIVLGCCVMSYSLVTLFNLKTLACQSMCWYCQAMTKASWFGSLPTA